MSAQPARRESDGPSLGTGRTRVLVTVENRFARTPDGAVWTPVQYARPFWDRYLEVFDTVTVVGRVNPVDRVPETWTRVDGDRVDVWGLPYYEGPLQFAQRYRSFRRSLATALDNRDAVICRAPSPIARYVQRQFGRAGRPYAVEVISDPWNVFSSGTMTTPLRPLYRRWFARHLRSLCREAPVSSYVTEFAIQRSYPPGAGTATFHYSDVELGRTAFVDAPKVFAPAAGVPIRLISVGSLAQLVKAPDIVLEAVQLATARGLDVRLTWVGDGDALPRLAALAHDLGISDRVRFTGALPAGEAVRRELDQADIFLLVSRQEGLPRALLEAMAQGLPCIGSRIGGIPELLPGEALVPVGDAASLAGAIEYLVRAPAFANALAEQNLVRSHAYAESELRVRRLAFLQTIREQTLAWNQGLTSSAVRNLPAGSTR